MRLQPGFYMMALWSAACSLIMSLQLVIGLGYVLSFFPLHLTMDLIYPEVTYFQHPVRGVFFYHCFMAAFLALYPTLLFMLNKKVSIFRDLRRVRAIAAIDGIILVLMITALLQADRFSYSPWLAQGALKVFLAAAVVSKIFWVKAGGISAWTNMFLARLTSDARSRGLLDAFFVLLITFIIFVPNIDALVAHVTMTGEGQRQNNYLVTAGAYAYSTGQIPYVNTLSWYGLGLPIIFCEMTKVFGPVTFENMTRVVMFFTIFYFILWYLLLKRWLGSMVWAAAAVLLMINLRVFGREGGPVIFYMTFNGTPIRFMFDIVFFGLVYAHLNTRKSWVLAAAGIVVGLDIFYITSTGICLAAAFCVYLVLLAMVQGCRKEYLKSGNDWALWRMAWLLVPLTFFVLTFIAVGKNMWTASFWHNFWMQLSYWKNGFLQSPISSLLVHKDGTPQWLVLIQALYLLSLTAAGTFLYAEAKTDLRLVCICTFAAYGLMDFQHLLMVGSGGVIFRNITISIVLLCFWADRMLEGQSQLKRKKLYWVFFFVVLYFLGINHHFIAYPNIFNFSRHPNTDPLVDDIVPGQGQYMNDISIGFPEQLKLPVNSLGEQDENLRTEKDFSTDEELVKYFHEEYTFDQDAALIRSLTPGGQKAPVISSQEVPLLMQAGRPPFFYVFPLLVARPMKLRTFPTDEIWTKENLLGAIKQMSDAKPEFVFVQKILLYPYLPQYYFYQYYPVIQLINYVRGHYEPYREGKYLIAMKRKGGQ